MVPSSSKTEVAITAPFKSFTASATPGRKIINDSNKVEITLYLYKIFSGLSLVTAYIELIIIPSSPRLYFKASLNAKSLL